ncbi:hypothetical protein GALL_117830 [mine drainage metagenome]|jgi:hypothetical protein|uniref:DUF6036 domain-containing protein n=1 Tax=mine drainage metagenome TaxID=410659 RepID=A0A1J5SCM9_9ZZZZ
MEAKLDADLNAGNASLRNAVGEIIHRISKSLPDIREPIKMYLAGGVAVNFYTGYRATDDVDASFSHKIILPNANELVVSYDDENGKHKMVYFDMNYNPTFALMHPDFEKDAALVEGNEFKDDKIKLYILSPVDLALSKVSRLEGNDREDIAELAKRKLISSKELEERAEEALSYYIGNQAMLRVNIQDVLEVIETVQQGLNHGINGKGYGR